MPSKTSDMNKDFSLVIPAYKAEKYIVENIKSIQEVLDKSNIDYEIIVVSDGALDKTFQKAKSVKDKRVKALKYNKNQGKGFAVRYGVLHGKGDVIGFIDSGMDLDPSGIIIALDFMKLHNADIVVGSKVHPDSEVRYPIHRKILTFCARFVTQFLFGFSILDTQVGLKIFTRKVADDVFPRLLVKKFAFDIEILALASVLGYDKIYEAPVKLNFKPGSISYQKLLAIVLKTFWDTLAIFYRIKILRYYRRRNKENWLKID